MPNHITNHLYISGEEQEVQECIKRLFNNGKNTRGSGEYIEVECIDFNSIASMPECLAAETSSGYLNNLVFALYGLYKKTFKVQLQGDLKRFFKILSFHRKSQVFLLKEIGLEDEEIRKKFIELDNEDFEKVLEYIKYIDSTGYFSWYEWSINNWGTKWNAYHSNHEKGTNLIEFDTAWSCPMSFIEKLSEVYPKLGFEIHYIDEDCYSNNWGVHFYKNGEFDYSLEETEKNKKSVCFDLLGIDLDDPEDDEEVEEDK